VSIYRVSFMLQYLLVILLILNCGSARGQSIAKYAGEFLAIGVGARPQGLGSSFVAIADGTIGSYWNPAGIGQLVYPQVSIMHAEHFGGELNYDFAGITIPNRSGTVVGMSFIRLGIDGIPDTRSALIDSVQANGRIDTGERLNINKITYFSNTDWTIYFTFAKRKSESLFIGSNIKIIERSLGSYSAWGGGFDIGMLFKINERFSIGANIMDATTTVVVWNTGKKELISPLLKAGGAYKLSYNPYHLTIVPVIDADIRIEKREFTEQYHIGRASINTHYGLELQYLDRLFFRTGYDDIRQISIGSGIHYKNVYIDYAYTGVEQMEELGSTHKISLSIDISKYSYRNN